MNKIIPIFLMILTSFFIGYNIGISKHLNIQQEIYVSDKYAYIKPTDTQDLIEIFVKENNVLNICKNGINNCQSIQVR